MNKFSLIVVLTGTILSSAAHAQQTSTSTSTSGSGAVAGSDASSNPVVTTTSGSNSSSGSVSGSNASSSSNPVASNAGNSQTINNNSVIPERQTIVAAPSVFAPALTTTLTETCMGSSSLGVSVLGWGASGGTTWQDRECVRRLNARELAQTIGDKEAAREVLCGMPADAQWLAKSGLGSPSSSAPSSAPAAGRLASCSASSAASCAQAGSLLRCGNGCKPPTRELRRYDEPVEAAAEAGFRREFRCWAGERNCCPGFGQRGRGGQFGHPGLGQFRATRLFTTRFCGTRLFTTRLFATRLFPTRLFPTRLFAARRSAACRIATRRIAAGGAAKAGRLSG